jgi:hypothetical protein
MEQVNVLAVVVAAVSTFVIGGLWYSPVLFAKPWMRANGFTDADLRRGSQGTIFALSFVFALISAVNLAMLLGTPEMTAGMGAFYGTLAGVWVALGIATVALFERRSWLYSAINGGYWLVSFAVMGAILGAWRT